MPSLATRVFTALVLIAVTIWSWNRRYETEHDLPEVRLDALFSSTPELQGNDGKLLVTQPEPGAPVGWLIPLPGFETAEALHLVLGLEGIELRQAAEDWQDGKVSLEGIDANGNAAQIYIGSVQDSWRFKPAPRIVRPPECVKGLFLRVEHLGASGSYKITDFNMFGVRSSFAGQLCFALTGGAWLIWIAWIGGPLLKYQTWLAAGIWILLASKTILPGPWAHEGPLGQRFAMSTSSSATTVMDPEPGQRVDVIGKLPETGGRLLRIKLYLKPIRPLLHGLLFLGPTLAFLTLLDRKSAIMLATFLVAGVEGAQWAFGFGFDGTDVLDILWDAMGIGLAVLIHPRLLQWAETRIKSLRLRIPGNRGGRTTRP